VTENERIRLQGDGNNEVAKRIRKTLLDLQYGRSDDKYGWLTRLV
ncbi:MAG TPA: branched chain amino acid aminotransferase, partial [Halomonas sp.]|nr:branched chain amino acid aminotransferase [Halomonas sp.]